MKIDYNVSTLNHGLVLKKKKKKKLNFFYRIEQILLPVTLNINKLWTIKS